MQNSDSKMDRGLLVLGAEGTLASAVLSRVASRYERFMLFDLVPKSERCQKLDLADSDEVTLAVAEAGIRSTSQWDVLSAVGSYQGGNDNCNSPDDVAYSIRANLVGVCQFCAALANSASTNGLSSRIVVVTSAAAHTGSRDIGYGASKAGLEGLVRSISKTYGRFGVTAIAVSPGWFPSAMSYRQSINRTNEAQSRSHLGRLTRFDEVIETVTYALIDAPDILSGSIINCSGGER